MILCDLMMPDLSGIDLYVRAMAAKPDLAPRFIFMTGAAFADSALDFAKRTGRVILEKPFDRTELLAAVANGLA